MANIRLLSEFAECDLILLNSVPWQVTIGAEASNMFKCSNAQEPGWAMENGVCACVFIILI
jgi:hypothetical protein